MKKNKIFKLLIAFSLLFILTGCGSKEEQAAPKKKLFSNTSVLTCTKEETDEEGLLTKEVMNITHDNKKVLKVSSVNIQQVDPETIDMSLGFGIAFAEVFKGLDGISVKYEKESDNTLKATTEVDYKKLDLPKLKQQLKEKLKSLYNEEEDDSFYAKDNYSFDEFKQEFLEEYSCK